MVEVGELRECPFCGGRADVTIDIGNRYKVECRDCSADVAGETKDDATEKWNRRAPDPERDEALSAANYYVALYEAEHESNVALDVYTKCARLLAGKGGKE